MATIPNYTELSPAFGRDYKTAKEVKEAFLSGERDFVVNSIAGQTYTNIRDGYIAPGTTVLLRYKRLTQVVALKVTAAHLKAVSL